MDFLNEFSRRVSSVARSVTERSKESGEVQRLNAQLRTAQEELDKLYCRYGMACYELKLGGGGREEAAVAEVVGGGENDAADGAFRSPKKV